MTVSVALERPEPEELARLMDLVGWGTNEVSVIARSVAAYPCTLCARSAEGSLVGYLSAFSDEVMTTMLGELVVHPQFRRQGVATSLLTALERRYPSAPIYIKALGESRLFYEAFGFKRPKAEIAVMYKRPSQNEAFTPAASEAKSGVTLGWTTPRSGFVQPGSQHVGRNHRHGCE